MVLAGSMNAINLLHGIWQIWQVFPGDDYKIIVWSLHRGSEFLGFHEFVFLVHEDNLAMDIVEIGPSTGL